MAQVTCEPHLRERVRKYLVVLKHGGRINKHIDYVLKHHLRYYHHLNPHIYTLI